MCIQLAANQGMSLARAGRGNSVNIIFTIGLDLKFASDDLTLEVGKGSYHIYT